ncbi:MAG: hypothetical protein WC279_13825 [Sulfurimonas sp.]|uniref:hypothetical protein n=1 Tax=Sulfurimonas sp. TaxID=2022749 RepID=UPI003569137A
MAKTVIITPASENIIRIPDGAPAECRLVISADDEDVTLDETEPVAVTGDTDKFTVTPDGDTRILKKAIPSVPDTLYYLHPDGSITGDPSGSVTLIAKGVEGGSYRAQTGEHAPSRRRLGGDSSLFLPNDFTTNICAMCTDIVTGNLYVFGTFSAIGAVSAANAAMWDGEVWSELGGGLVLSYGFPSMRVAAHPDGGFVLHCIYLTQAGAVPVTGKGVVRWTGSEWIDLQGIAEGGYVTISEEGDIYIGNYVYANGVWSGIANEGITGAVTGICPIRANGTDLIYGNFTAVDYFPANKTAEKIGKLFENTYPYPLPSGTVHTILADPDETLYLALGVTLRYWDGTTWTPVPGFPSLSGSLTSFIVDTVTGTMLLCGQFYDSSGPYYPGGLVTGSGSSWTYYPFSSNVLAVQGLTPGQVFLACNNGGWRVYEFNSGDAWS